MESCYVNKKKRVEFNRNDPELDDRALANDSPCPRGCRLAFLWHWNCQYIQRDSSFVWLGYVCSTFHINQAVTSRAGKN